MTEDIVRWVKIRSWHAAAGWSSRGGLERTICGRFAPLQTPVEDRPGDEKSCETCLRKITAGL